MKIARFKYGSKAKFGILKSDYIYEIDGDVFENFTIKPIKYNISDVELLSPVKPSKIICIGKNYKEHIDEFDNIMPSEPVLFIKPPSSVIGPDDNIILPEMSKRVDYEGELAAVIKTRCKNVKVEDVPKIVLGYTCGNDVTARDLQKKDGQWTRAKSFDTFCPLGPCIETEIDPKNLLVQTYVNGELRQQCSTKMMITPVYELISFISNIMTLEPQDVIMSGTPAGVGPLKRGDVVEVNIEGIGILKNSVL